MSELLTSSTPRTHDVANRLLVTLAVLVVYRAGLAIPLPGLDHATLAQLAHSAGSALAVERISIFTLGLMPLLTALSAGEIAKLAFPGLRNWVEASPPRYAAVMVAFALLIAAVQSAGFASAMVGVDGLVVDPGWPFFISTVVTLVAATAALIWLAHVVTRHGVGYGFWVLLLASVVAALPTNGFWLVAAAQNGEISTASLIAAFAVPLASAAMVVAAQGWEGKSPQALLPQYVWPPILGYLALGLIAGAASFVSTTTGNVGDWLQAGQLPGVIVLAALMYGFANAYRQADTNPFFSLVLTAVVVAPEIVKVVLGTPVLIDGRWVAILVAVVLACVAHVRSSAQS